MGGYKNEVGEKLKLANGDFCFCEEGEEPDPITSKGIIQLYTLKYPDKVTEYAALRAKADRLQDRVQNILEYIAECKGGSISIEGRLTAIENTLSRALEQESKEGNKCIGIMPSVNGIQPDQPSAIGILPLLSGLQPEGENKGGIPHLDSPILRDKDVEDWKKLTTEEMQERKEAIDWYRNPEGEKEPIPQQGPVTSVYVPCLEDDPRVCGGYTSNDGQSLAYVRESKVPIVEGPVWVKASEHMPEHNVGVLVFIPGEDNHITSGMWDIGNEWVLLDEYRVPDCEVTHWMELPGLPEGVEGNDIPDEFAQTIKSIARQELGLTRPACQLPSGCIDWGTCEKNNGCKGKEASNG